ncbi:MAG: M56 family metallopeptidase, partial [Lachnospiraceae bacterium]|nr:M56 family metallopeptidase [Lachnospiraceae bacterium]
QYLKMRRRIKGFMTVEEDKENRVVTLRGLDTPLLFGFLKPMVYLPDGLKGEERAYIIRHELYHRRRRDNIVKAAVLCLAIAYWYNPLVWLAFHFFGVDMELSCDEAVLLKSDTDIKKAYAGSLLKYGALQNHYILTSLTFGEPGLRARIKNVLNFKKHGVIITVAAVLAVALLAVGLLVRPAAEGESAMESESAAEEANITLETYGWTLEEKSVLHNGVVMYEITDAYQYGEITGNYVSEDSAYVAYHLEDARICVLSTHDAGESWQQTYIGESNTMDALGVIYLSFLESGTGYL